MSHEHLKSLDFNIKLLQWTIGIICIVIGADKFFHVIVNWHQYLSPALAHNLPFAPLHQIYIVGVIEIMAGFIVLSPFARFGAYLVAAWVFVVIGNLLLLGGYYDIIIRDFIIAIACIALGNLIGLRARLQR